jgi:Flp pilus assembly protein TadG
MTSPVVRPRWRGVGGDRGSVAAELTLITPLLLILLLFVILAGRLAGTRLRLDDVAHQAARAASAARTTSAAERDARSTAQAALDAAGISCRDLQVTVDAAGLQPGTAVRATVACTVELGDLSLLSVPGTARLSSTFTSPVDVYRQAPGEQG